MSSETATAETTQDESYEDLFNQMVDNKNSDAKLGSESDEDTAEAEELEEEDLDDERADGDDDSSDADATNDPKQSTPEGWEKRYRDLQSYADRRYNAMAAEKQELEARLTALEQASRGDETTKEPPQKEAPKFDIDGYVKNLPEEDRELFEDNPSLLKVMADITSKMVPQNTIDESKIADIVSQRIESIREQELEKIRAQEVEAAKERVRSQIPDIEEILNDREFQIWRADNETRVSDILGRADDDAEGVINVIKYFQSMNAMQTTRNAVKRSAAKGTAGAPKGTSPRATAKPNEEDYDAAFEYYAQGRK